MEKSRLAQSESSIVQEARQLRGKLIDIKTKHELKNTALVKAELADLYNAKFEHFKRQLEQKAEDQLTSLELNHELRHSEITDVESKLKQFMNNLAKQ